ncbi:hypothetical protein B0H21DRAFT_467144 [Amylocystis lapponica]|nr:hypothetical protein B0H21DRAFT_467144 [Amylocystis lapponica]
MRSPTNRTIVLRRRLSQCLNAVTDKIHTPRRRREKDRQSSKIPYIPAEIWGLIIQQACLTYHDPLDTSRGMSFLESECTRLRTYQATMVIKLAVSLVSREWNELARPFLYEFVWISRAIQAKSLAKTLLIEFVGNGETGIESSGRYIRRLHIETPALERCAPADLRTILDYAPHLCIYSDHRSVQRRLYEDAPDPRCSPEAILKLIAQPKMRRLSWTSYDDVPFQLRMSPLLKNLTTKLEYLELSSCSPISRTVFAESLAQLPDKELMQMNVCLPSLRALKMSLDNNTFAVLASWDMPALTHLSVMSSDFSYTGEGFARFFQAHGEKLVQLELGHSSSLIEEHYLTMPQHLLVMQHLQSHTPVPLAEWCPNLREFICSADAEWHWQSPDWIAPHILLPSHPRIELIGIRDIDARLEDMDAPIAADFDTPYFSLVEQLWSLLQRDTFPNLRFVRDLSMESHRMRTVRPRERIVEFWTRVVGQCQERSVWLENCFGVNITVRDLQRASLPQDTDA